MGSERCPILQQRLPHFEQLSVHQLHGRHGGHNLQLSGGCWHGVQLWPAKTLHAVPWQTSAMGRMPADAHLEPAAVH